MKVLALASYPTQAAATRYRLEQFVAPLSKRDITLTIRPFLDADLFGKLYQRGALPRTAIGLTKAALLRPAVALAARRADVVLIQREAMIFGPPVIEWLIARVLKRPMVLDLDDATYVAYSSPTYGALGQALKWFSKTDDLIRWSKIVTCGNRSIAEYVSSKGARASIIPTVVDTDVFKPDPTRAETVRPVLGWIGTHSTFPYLESIFPILSELARTYEFTLRIVGSGRGQVTVPGVEVENLIWNLEREVRDFQSIDIGLYPIDASLYSGKWAAGKSGFKAIQYMAVGVPYVATPVGASAEIGEVGITHFCASTGPEWAGAIETLLKDPQKRREMGAAGRAHSLENYRLETHAEMLASALRDAADMIGSK